MFVPGTSSTIYKLIPSGRVWLCVDPIEYVDSRDPAELPARPVNVVTQDARGYIWIGTEHGPLLYDGLLCSAPPALVALQGSIVHSFCFTGDRTLWIGTRGTGIARARIGPTGPHLEPGLTHAQGLPDNTVRALCVDRRGHLWAGTQDGIAVIAHDEVVRCLNVRDGLPSPRVNALCQDMHGRLWIGTEHGLIVLADGMGDDRLISGPGFESCSVKCIYGDPDGRIWVGTLDGDLFQAEAPPGGAARLRRVHEGDGAINALCVDDQGRLWAGTRQGAYVFADGVLRDALTCADGLPSAMVLDLHRDHDGRIWAGTMRGLVVLKSAERPVRPLGGAASPDKRLVWTFADDRRGRLWLGTETGIALVDSDREQAVPLPELPPTLLETPVWCLRWDRDGQLWAGTRRRGLFYLDPATGDVHAQLLADRDVAVFEMCVDATGRLWIGTAQHGLICIDTRARCILREIGPAEGLPDAQVHGLELDRHGRLWAGTASCRLVCIDPASGAILHTVVLGGETSPHIVTGLARDAEGLLWVCTWGGGLMCVNPERPALVRTITTADGLPSNIVLTCQIDAQGYLWLGTGRGVVRFEPRTSQCVTLDQGRGLPHYECDSNALHLDARGRLWVGTAKGPAIVDTAQIPDDVPPSPAYLTGFRVMGREREITPEMELEDTEYDLEFEYGAVSFTAPMSVLYRVQLVGLEAGWSAATPLRRQRYTNLRPGTYTFRVAVCNWGGHWSAPLEVPFRVVRDRKAQEAEEALERERIEKEVYRATVTRLEELNRRLAETDRLKTELIEKIQEQAAIFAHLSRYDDLTGLLNRRALDERLAVEFDHARRSGQPLSVVLGDIDHFKRINDTYSHLVGDAVLETVARLCMANIRGADSVGRYGGEEIVLVLPQTTAAAATELCERLRLGIAGYAWETLAAGLRVTISFGVAGSGDAPDHATMLAAADASLYLAKRSGRNRTCAQDDPAAAAQYALPGLH